jgi:hypothetical protein
MIAEHPQAASSARLRAGPIGEAQKATPRPGGGQEDNPRPVRIATDAANASDILEDALEAFRCANNASRLEFDWEAHITAAEELRALLRHPSSAVFSLIHTNRQRILHGALPGVEGLRNRTATASTHLLRVRPRVHTLECCCVLLHRPAVCSALDPFVAAPHVPALY